MKQPISFVKTLIPLGISIFCFFFYCWAQSGPTSTARNDFLNLYVSGKLACTAQLFSTPAMLEWHKTLIGVVMPTNISLRPPYYALVLAPLARLPYTVAYLVFLGIDVLAVFGFVFLMRKRSPTIALTCSLCLPLLLSIGNGQDVPILIFLFALSIFFHDRGQDFIAGLVLSLCAFKGQFFLLFPLVLLLRRRWRYFFGGVAGAVVLMALSFIAGGPGWIGEYLRLVERPGNNPTSWQMGNLRALADGLHGGLPLQIAMVAVALVLFVWMVSKLRATNNEQEPSVGRASGPRPASWQAHSSADPNLDFGLGAAILAGLLISPHGYLADYALMLPASILLEPHLKLKFPKLLNGVVMSPFPYLAAMLGFPFSVLLPASALTLFASLAPATRNDSASPR